jgi:hypothetical protein
MSFWYGQFLPKNERKQVVLWSVLCLFLLLLGCSIDAAQQQMALNFELVVSNQLFSVVLAAFHFKISAPGVGRRHK